MKKNVVEKEDLYLKGYLQGITDVGDFLISDKTFSQWYGEDEVYKIENEWITLLQILAEPRHHPFDKIK